MKTLTWLLLISNLFIGAGAQDMTRFAAAPKTEIAVKKKTLHYKLGDKRVPVHVTAYGNNRHIVMINVHSDETTGLDAARQVLQQTGGILINIENDRQRLITFSMDGETWKFDPNRMFTRTGITANLQRLNKRQSNRAVREIEGFARFLLRKLPHFRTLIALHNNDPGNLSILTYVNNEGSKNDVQAVHASDRHDPDNFYLTTDQNLFGELRNAGYNIILQHNRKATDDGSLSVYLGRKNKSYINVEAENGRFAEQLHMIEQVLRYVRKR